MVILNPKLIFIVALGIFLRLSLRFSSYYVDIAKRVEVSSPVTSWQRVVEGVTLNKLNISVYDGDTFHESPIFLHFYKSLIDYLNEYQIALLFITIDIITAFVLSTVTIKQLKCISFIEEKRMQTFLEKDKGEKIYQNLMIQPGSASALAFWSTAVHVLSPYTMLSCVGQSTSVFSNFLIAITLLNSTNGSRLISLFLLSLLTLNSFYPLILLPSIVLLIEQHLSIKKHSKNGINIDFRSTASQISIVYSIFTFIIFYIFFFIISLYMENWSFEFIKSTYVFMWTVNDLTPNIGLFWYFFTEMFDHFRTFFLWVFQINYFIYIIPLTCNLWKNSYFLSLISLIIHSLFKPYPTISDFSLYLAILPQWSHLFENMKSTLVVSCTIVTTSVLAPILWYLWIILGTANSNFYFGITLAYNVAQIFLITDLIFSYVKREFYISNLNLYKLCKKTGKVPKIELSYK